MIALPPEPSAKDPISATFMKALMRCIRANTLINGPGYRTKRGPNGTTLELLASQSAKSVLAKDNGRFAINLVREEQEEGSESEQTYSATFANPYYDIGGKTYEMTADEEADPPAVHLEGIPDGAIVILVVDASGTQHSASLDYCQRIQELQDQQENDVEHYTIPLYRVQGGKVVCDFRTGPISGMGEP